MFHCLFKKTSSRLKKILVNTVSNIIIKDSLQGFIFNGTVINRPHDGSVELGDCLAGQRLKESGLPWPVLCKD